MSRKRSIWMLAASLALLLAAACSGDDADNTQDATAHEPSPTSSAGDDIGRRIKAILADGGPSFGEFNSDELRRMMEIDNDEPFYMVNFIKFRQFAAYPDGHDSTLSGREANARYNALPIILEIGGRPIFVAGVEQQLIGEDTKWDQVVVVQYPSREAFISMLERPDFQETSAHKDAGVEKSIVIVAEARDLPAIPPADTATLPYPPTAEDPSFMMVHLMHFAEPASDADGAEDDQGGGAAIADYEQAVAIAALPLGIRPAAILEVEGVLVGDGREWDEVRLNRFPSHAAFDALTENPAWQSQQSARADALADTYALITLPLIDAIGQP